MASVPKLHAGRRLGSKPRPDDHVLTDSSGRKYRVTRNLAEEILTYIDVRMSVTIDEVQAKFDLGRRRTSLFLRKMANEKILKQENGEGHTLHYRSLRTPVDEKLIFRTTMMRDSLQRTYLAVLDHPGSNRKALRQLRGVSERTLREHLKALMKPGFVSDKRGKLYAQDPEVFQVDTTGLDYTVAVPTIARRQVEKSALFVGACSTYQEDMQHLVEASIQAVQAFGYKGRDRELIQLLSHAERFEEACEVFSTTDFRGNSVSRLEPAASLVANLGNTLRAAAELLARRKAESANGNP